MVNPRVALLAGFFVLSISGLPQKAQAAYLDFTTPAFAGYMGELSVGDWGDASMNGGLMAPTNGSEVLGIGAFFGSIPSHSKITFTYTANYLATMPPCSLATCNGDPNLNSAVFMSGLYDKTVPVSGGGSTQVTEWVWHHNFFNDEGTSGDYEMKVAGSRPEVFLSMLSSFPDDSHAVIELRNMSEFRAEFRSFLLTDGNGAGFATFSVSPVPLPAALPLFGLGIVGLAGYRRLSQKRKVS